MAIKFISVKCPDCGAPLDIEEGRKQIFCSYCGAKVLIDNDNEYIYHHIDEAKIKQAEVDETVQLKKLELLEKTHAEAARVRRIKIIISILMGIVGGVLMLSADDTYSIVGLMFFVFIGWIWLFSLNNKNEDDDIDLGEKVKVPSIINYQNKNYASVEVLFTNAGFTNVKCIPLNDLTTGLLKKPGMVESITINGETVISGGKKYSPDVTVIISYHSHR